MEVSGNISENIVVIHKLPIAITNNNGIKESVKPALFIDSDSYLIINTAIKWAGQNYQKLVIKNKPMVDLRIVAKESKNGGPSIYKVVDTDGYYFDLHDDVLMECIMDDGIKPSGILTGAYIWAKLGSSMKIVKVGSSIYNALTRSTNRKKLPKIDNKDLKAGNVYMTRSGRRYIYMGHVNTIYMSFKDSISDLKKSQYLKRILLYRINNYNTSSQEQIDLSLQSNNLSQLELTTNTNFVEKLEQLNIDKDIISTLRRIAIREAADSINSKSGNSMLVVRSAFAHMHDINKKIPETPEYVKFLTLA